MAREQRFTKEQKHVELFTGIVMYLRTIQYTLDQLDKAEKENALLTKSAPDFFSMLNMLLIKEFYLEACKLTDPATFNNKCNNLTVGTIVDRLGWTNEQLCTLNDQKKKLDNFRSKIG